jgi:hypothetical protein
MNTSQNKFVYAAMAAIAPKMHLSLLEYKHQLANEVLKNSDGSIKTTNAIQFIALRARLMADAHALNIDIQKSNTTTTPAPTHRGKKQADIMRKKLISMAYTMNWASAGDWKKAIAQIDAFLQSHKSIFKKPLMLHSAEELSYVVTQFEQMLKNHYRQISRLA